MAIDPRNIQFEIIDDSDSPFQLEFNPKNTILRVMKSENSTILFNKIKTRQFMGYIVELDLVWTNPVFFDEDQHQVLFALFKETDPFYVYPNPSAEPALKFLVSWDNGFEFESGHGFLDGFSWFGTINLLGAELLQKEDLPEWAFYEYD